MKIAVDPGHGMSNRQTGVYDPGATHVENGFRHEEATIALKYGLALKDAFRAQGHEVFMTRDDAEDHAPVGMRAKNATNAGCEVFISIHLNDFDDDRANGQEVLYGKESDRRFATAIQESLLKITKFANRGIFLRQDLAVFKFGGPAVLIELGFIAHDGDRELLLNPQIRSAICNSVLENVISLPTRL